MKQVYVRPAGEQDIPNLSKWMAANANANRADEDAMSYPATSVMAAYTDEKVVMYMPIQMIAMLESLAPNPEVSDSQCATALREMVKTTIFTARTKGIGEIYFLLDDRDEALGRFARKHGFEEIPAGLKAYRLKVKDTEGKPSEPSTIITTD